MVQCKLCHDGTVIINSIFGLSMTSRYSTYDIGTLEDIRFCPKCGRKMEKLPVSWSTAFEDCFRLSTEEGE